MQNNTACFPLDSAVILQTAYYNGSVVKTKI